MQIEQRSCRLMASRWRWRHRRVEADIHLHHHHAALGVAGMMARLIGAAPRQRGNSEACRLRQPSSAHRGWPAAGSCRRRRPRPHRPQGAELVERFLRLQGLRRQHRKAELSRRQLDRRRPNSRPRRPPGFGARYRRPRSRGRARPADSVGTAKSGVPMKIRRRGIISSLPSLTPPDLLRALGVFLELLDDAVALELRQMDHEQHAVQWSISCWMQVA